MAEEKTEVKTLPEVAKEFRHLVNTAKGAAKDDAEKALVQPWEQHADLLEQHLEEREQAGELERWLQAKQGEHHATAARRRYDKAAEALKPLTNRAARAKADKG